MANVDGEINDMSVRILFPGLTHAGKMYDFGEIENNPTPFLVEAAKKKSTMFHGDSSKDLRIARFVKKESGKFTGRDADIDEESEVVVPKVKSIDDDITEMNKPELVAMANKFGILPKVAKEYDKEQLGKLLTFMRKL
jgi:hypothetical protein